MSILRQRQAFAADGAIGGSGRTGDVWRRPAMPGTPGSPVDHLQAHGTASGRGCRDGRSGSRALDKTFQPLVTRTSHMRYAVGCKPREAVLYPDTVAGANPKVGPYCSSRCTLVAGGSLAYATRQLYYSCIEEYSAIH